MITEQYVIGMYLTCEKYFVGCKKYVIGMYLTCEKYFVGCKKYVFKKRSIT